MRKGALFITGISVLIFSGCAQMVTAEKFDKAIYELKKAHNMQDEAAMRHLELTKKSMEDIKTLDNRLGNLRYALGFAINKLARLDQATAQALKIIVKGLEYRGIKIDFQKTWERIQKEEIEKRLKEQSK